MHNDSRATAYVLANSAGMSVEFLDIGGIITAIRTPDRQGRAASVVLGYDHLDQYLADSAYLGALIGRYANRIAYARFDIDGNRYKLRANDGQNHLHGGPGGFHRVKWTVTPFGMRDERGAVLKHVSPAGHEGYPGELSVTVTYTLNDDCELRVEYLATTTEPTHVNLTQHSYFNLSGKPTDILGHELTILASEYTPVTRSLIPTGELREVAGTPFDFRGPHAVGALIDSDDSQLAIGDGYDHNFVLDAGTVGQPVLAAQLRDPSSGRRLDILTTEPGLQFYSGNKLMSALPTAMGNPHIRRGGLALETQHFPDSPNRPEFPSTLLGPGETYRSRTIYRFSTDS